MQKFAAGERTIWVSFKGHSSKYGAETGFQLKLSGFPIHCLIVKMLLYCKQIGTNSVSLHMHSVQQIVYAYYLYKMKVLSEHKCLHLVFNKF